MKNKIIKIIPLIILTIILSISIFSSLYDYNKEIKNNYFIAQQEYNKKCELNITPEYENWCKQTKDYLKNKPNYWEVVINTLANIKTKGFILAFILILPITFTICRYLKNNNFNYQMQREKYSNILKELILTAYKPTIIFAIILLIFLLISYKISSGFNYTYMHIENLGQSEIIFKHPITTSIIFILINILNSLIYANLTLISIRNNKKFIQSTLISMLSIVLLELLFEIIFGALLCNIILKINDSLIFNIVNGMSTSFSEKLTWHVVFHIIIYILTTFITIQKFKNKEQLIMDYQ